MSRALALVDSSDEQRKYDSTQGASGPALLETKLYIPRSRSVLVARPRLTSLLHHTGKLTLVSAPAGFGKTTLVADWLADAGVDNVAWVSLDSNDNDPRRFWAYVSRALRSSPSGTVDGIVTTLINDAARADADGVLVLDDYHVIDEPEIHRALISLLEHLPPRLHVVITSRSDPPIGLPRLRARGELVEIRAADLRFTREEASAFFSQVMALDLSPADLSTLEQRTEGWVAGLKLAALSMKGRDDVPRFVEGFSGGNRHIADYLVEEVLRAEPDSVRRFLLSTAVLDRLSGPLCDAVTGETGSQSLLEDLERRNLFIVALDDRREWFRYHHLFADVLQKQSTATSRASHARASVWYEQNGAVADAVRHAIAAGESARSADLLERTWPEKNRSYDSAAWLGRVKTLPDEVIRSRPVLAMGYAWALLNAGDLEAAELRLLDVERALRRTDAPVVVSDQQRFASLGTELASARIYLAQSRGDTPGTLEHAQQALHDLPNDDPAARATSIALIALAHWGRGELEPAHRTFSDALAAMRAAGHQLDAIRGAFVLGDIRVAQGGLREADEAYERGLAVAAESSQYANAETDELHLGLSELYREWNDLASATRHLDVIAKRADKVAHKTNLQRWCVAKARVSDARGDAGDALALLDEAEKHERRDPLPRVRPIPALKARIRIARGDVDAAAAWAPSVGIGIDDELSYLREFEHITLARLLIAQRGSQAGAVLPFLERLDIAARTGGRIGSVIEIVLLQSIVQQAGGNGRAALDSLTEALTFAEPHGYLRIFLDEGDRVRDLLRTAVARGLAGGYSRRVLSAFEAPGPAAATPAPAEGSDPLLQPLTVRELEILQLIAAGLRNQEIADALSISAATVKRHIANAYGKLGAGHRTEALVRAAELNLL